MKKSLVFIFIFLVIQPFSFSQKVKPKYSSINQVGVTWGGSDQDLHLQTVNGVFYKTFTAGLGVALDYYFHRTVPVFIDLRKDLFAKTETPFVYADLGLNMPWIKKNGEQTWQKSEYDHGSYFDVGLGYKIKVHKKFSANLGFGYSQKTTKEKRTWSVRPFDILPGNENGYESYNYTLRRFSVKAGLSF